MASGGVVRTFVCLLETIWRHQSRDIDGLGHPMMMDQACKHTNINKSIGTVKTISQHTWFV